MRTLATASRVLGWAADPAGMPPAGDLHDAESLARPDTEAHSMLQRLAVRTAAVLGAGRPPFGDDGPVGLGALLLAAAVGGRADAEAARRIVDGVPALRLLPGEAGGDASRDSRAPGWADAVARHGIVGAFAEPGVSASATDDLTEAMLAASPLTAILLRPPSARAHDGDYREPLKAVTDLVARPRGLEVLTTALARPARDAATLAWRTVVVIRLAAGNRDAVLGIYLAARVRHGAEWDDLLDWAADGTGQATVRTAVRRFWAPLAVLDQEDPALLRSQPFLDGYRRALELAAPYIPASAKAH